MTLNLELKFLKMENIGEIAISIAPEENLNVNEVN